MLNDYPNSISIIGIQPYGSYSCSWATARYNFYHTYWDPDPYFYFPAHFEDGLNECWPYTGYEAHFLARRAVPTDVTIELIGVETTTNTYDITARICLETGGTDKTVRLRTVQVLDNWAVTDHFDRNIVRQGVADDVVLTAGNCEEVVNSLSFDATDMAKPDDIKIIAFAQEPVATWGRNTAEVHQSQQMLWPFPTAFPIMPIFTDGFESGDLTAWTVAVP